MAVKYKRDPEAKFDWNVRGRTSQQIRKKTMYIYGGLGIAFIASLVFHFVGQGNFANWHGPFTTVAVVTDKIVQFEGEPTERRFIQCEVETADLDFGDLGEDVEIPERISAQVRVDKDGWESLETGTVVHVVCSITPDFGSLRIQRIWLDTLVLDSPTLLQE